MEEEVNVKHVGIRVAGLVIGIIAVIALVSVIFSLTVLPVVKYSNAQKNAEAGNYDVAARILYNMSYKDSEQKFGEYALVAGEKYFNEGDMENASIYLTYALNSENEDAAAKAQEYFDNSSGE